MNDLSGGKYSVNKNIKFKTPMLRSDLCHYSDACITVKATVDVLATSKNKNDKPENEIQFKNKVPLRSCISKTNNSLINSAEDLDIVMPMYNLLG